MKTLPPILLTLLLLLTTVSYAQLLPFQGKLLEQGQPVNATLSFTFGLAGDGWTENHPAVEVVDGLYSVLLGSTNPMPLNLFDYQVSRELTLSVDGSPLPNIPIYAPLGRFTTVPNNPTGEFVVGRPDTLHQTAAEVTSTTNQVAVDSTWQSFTPAKNGWLTQATLTFGNLNGTALRLRVYAGEGLGGTVLYDSLYPAANFSAGVQQQVFVVPATAAVSLQATQPYTLQWVGETAKFTANLHEGDPFSSGRADLAPTTDLQFSVSLDEVLPIAFKADAYGNVGVGTDAPGARLQVQGEDYSGETSALLVTNYLNDTLLDVRNDGAIKRVSNWVDHGVLEWSPSSINQTLEIEHNLGFTPQLFEILWAVYDGGDQTGTYGHGFFDGSENEGMRFGPWATSIGGYTFSETLDNEVIRIRNANTNMPFRWSARVIEMDENIIKLQVNTFSSPAIIHFTWKVYY